MSSILDDIIRIEESLRTGISEKSTKYLWIAIEQLYDLKKKISTDFKNLEINIAESKTKFILSEKEEAALRLWKADIIKKYGQLGNLTFHFYPTGIGDRIIVETDLGPKIDITDHSSW